jgi:hypothetical protein
MTRKHIYVVICALLIAVLANSIRFAYITQAQSAMNSRSNLSHQQTNELSNQEITARIERLRQIVPNNLWC